MHEQNIVQLLYSSFYASKVTASLKVVKYKKDRPHSFRNGEAIFFIVSERTNR